jgi:hypothetical protein
MDGLASQFALQGVEHQLMLANAVKTRKGSADHLHLEVVAATGEVLHLNGGIGKGMANGILHLIRMHHGGTEWV